jgi:hypothetical protein
LCSIQLLGVSTPRGWLADDFFISDICIPLQDEDATGPNDRTKIQGPRSNLQGNLKLQGSKQRLSTPSTKCNAGLASLDLISWSFAPFCQNTAAHGFN